MSQQTDVGRQNATKAELIAEIEDLELQLKMAAAHPTAGKSPFINSILDSLPVGIAYIDQNRTYQFANEQYRRLLECLPDAVIGKHMRDILDTETYKVAKVAAEKALAGTPVSFQDTLRFKGSDRFLNVNYLPDSDHAGHIAGYFAMVHDVTKQHHLQSELAGSEQRYQTLVDAVPHGIEEIDIDGNILFANATHHKQYGYEPNALIGMNIVELLPTLEEAEPLLNHLKYLAKEQPPIEPYFGKKKKKDGTLIDVKIEWTYKRDADNKVIGFTTVIADVTEQIKAERLQKENADRLELSLRSANIGTFSWNVVEGGSYWDDRMHDIWGLPRGAFVGHKPEDFIATLHSEDRSRVLEAIERTMEDDAPYDTEYRIYRPDGTIAFVQVLASVERDAQGRATKLSGVAIDISERKLIENMKNEFVSTVSHELRTPLTSIRGALGLVTGGALGTIPPEALDVIVLAERNASALTKLVNDILDFERAESGKLEFKFERFNLIEFIEENLRSHQGLAEKYDVQFQFSPDQSYIELEADSDRLAQVMANLLSNAAKHSPKKEVIKIDVRSNTKTVEVFVTDKGSGIPDKFHDIVFDRFTQADATDDRNFGGTGLGLSIAKLIIEHHRGKIDFESSPETGTRFRFEIPLIQTSRRSN